MAMWYDIYFCFVHDVRFYINGSWHIRSVSIWQYNTTSKTAAISHKFNWSFSNWEYSLWVKHWKQSLQSMMALLRLLLSVYAKQKMLMMMLQLKRQRLTMGVNSIWCFLLSYIFISFPTIKWTSGSAVAEGPRDVLVSRNSATYKTSHLKTRVSGLSCGLFADRRTDGRTDTRRRHVPHLVERRAVKIDYRPIALPTKYNYQATSVSR